MRQDRAAIGVALDEPTFPIVVARHAGSDVAKAAELKRVPMGVTEARRGFDRAIPGTVALGVDINTVQEIFLLTVAPSAHAASCPSEEGGQVGAVRTAALVRPNVLRRRALAIAQRTSATRDVCERTSPEGCPSSLMRTDRGQVPFTSPQRASSRYRHAQHLTRTRVHQWIRAKPEAAWQVGPQRNRSSGCGLRRCCTRRSHASADRAPRLRPTSLALPLVWEAPSRPMRPRVQRGWPTADSNGRLRCAGVTRHPERWLADEDGVKMARLEGHVPLEDVFKLSGVPTYTFVEPTEYNALRVALRTPGRGVVIEGPSGIGKTTAVRRAAQGQHLDPLLLSSRRADDVDIIRELPRMSDAGLVIIDDFHRLDDFTKNSIADHMKLLADEENTQSKVVVLGINRAGQSLIDFASDLSGRLDIIRFESNPPAKVAELVRAGTQVMNVRLPEQAIVRKAQGSFSLAQRICYHACLAAGYLESPLEVGQVAEPLEVILERVVDELAVKFMDTALQFATGPNFSKEGRAPYLQVLQWLARADEPTINLDREMHKHPEVQRSVFQIVNGGHLATFLEKNPRLADLLHFDARTRVLAVEDPSFHFFLKNVTWGKFAERVGYLNVGFSTRYDFALSFAGSDRNIVEMLVNELSLREFSVFYDSAEQAKILAANLEEYLAPIYASEATFVLCVMGPNYPSRVWAVFESNQFRARFGAESVIPIWANGALPSMFDEAGKVGGYFFNHSEPLKPQVEYLAELLQEKIADFRLSGPVPPGKFRCRACHLILPVAVLTTGRTAVCEDCDEGRAMRLGRVGD